MGDAEAAVQRRRHQQLQRRPAGAGQKPLGPFYELETSSPAAALAPGASLTHVHRTFHVQGDAKDLDALALELLGVSLATIEKALSVR